MRTALPTAALALALSACASTVAPMPTLATARVVDDFDTYRLGRVGLMPFEGEDLTDEQSAALEAAFFTELSHSTPFELVTLDTADLEEIRVSEPYRRGWYRPETILGLSRRYSLDAVLFGTVTQSQFFPPQKLSVQVDMVAAETGLVIWSSSVHLDASERRVRDGLEAYFTDPDGRESDEGQDWRLSLLSPSRFAQFAAFQVATLL
ncbi:MAG: hypothetical protein AAF682_08915 [Planctomycetota bacterium]